MATKSPRVHVALDKATRDALAVLAKRDNKTLSGVAKEMIEEALDLQEDIYFSRLVDERNKKVQKHFNLEEVCEKLGLDIE